MRTLDPTIYAMLHDLSMRIPGVSVQSCNGREANHEKKVSRQCLYVNHEETCARLHVICMYVCDQ